MIQILGDSSKKITYALLDTGSWTTSRASICNGVFQILAQKDNWTRYDAVRLPLYDVAGATGQPQVCIDYRPSDKPAASRTQLSGQFIINVANLLSGRPRSISEDEEDEALRVFACVLGMIEEQIALHRQHTSLLKSPTPTPDICDAAIWGNVACSADRATANLLALECASRMAPNEYFNPEMLVTEIDPDKSKHKEKHPEANNLNKDISIQSDEQVPAAFWRLLCPENYTWRWILDLDDLHTLGQIQE
ncbi:hypothetical protein HYPSUDRAFT_1001241 [Hypholoma sublateritium FD-334 SS-4]|uniref:Uncharacterized protein n=1 Tax=Hypholoma sublateritium (strain FD-334 SS-4) TaxID=945553 RepID=A0A0D2NM64_HYPSF|nr:hypothetical protein HYPSUDRAFT_1001241 [Hypholoma sublateritium FD-334 SS-4]